MHTTRQELSALIEPYWDESCVFRTIDCGNGWNDLIADLHRELVKIDKRYTIVQIKEKFGVLRVYCRFSTKRKQKKAYAVLIKYERLSSTTCEVTGRQGSLMRKRGCFKVLNIDFLEEGWTIVKP